MPTRLLPILVIALAICRPASADEKYTFHENLHTGQKLPFVLVYDYKTKSAAKTNGVSSDTDATAHFDWKGTITVQAVKDGSQTRARIEVDPTSSDSATSTGQTSKTTPCPFAGKTVVVTRNADESFGNDFTGTASDDDVNILNNFISPDEDYYPDHPVAVGESWDVSAKLSKHSQLSPGDTLLSDCRLDWVKTINGKPMAQISNSIAVVYREPGHIEEDYEATGRAIVDLTTQMIVKADQTGGSTYKTSPNASTQITGGTESTYHCEILPR